jgi:hypothetical protein
MNFTKLAIEKRNQVQFNIAITAGETLPYEERVTIATHLQDTSFLECYHAVISQINNNYLTNL